MLNFLIGTTTGMAVLIVTAEATGSHVIGVILGCAVSFAVGCCRKEAA